MRIIHCFPVLIFCFACNEPASRQLESQTAPEPERFQYDSIIIKESVIDYDSSQWKELLIEQGLVLDIRYATNNNFVSEQLYNCARCFLRPAAAAALLEANDSLNSKGYKLKLFDCFRPLPVQQRLWDKFQNASYVTPPSKGSMHNRGLAVDLTIVDTDGKELDMGTEFDYFGREAHHDFIDLSDEILNNRQLLKRTMESFGFKGIRTEWWHYSFSGKLHKLSDMLWECDSEKE